MIPMERWKIASCAPLGDGQVMKNVMEKVSSPSREKVEEKVRRNCCCLWMGPASRSVFCCRLRVTEDENIDYQVRGDFTFLEKV